MTLKFRKEKLPNPLEYFEKNDIKILGRGEWRTALCPFHADTKPSLSVKIENGAFRCFACSAKGGDILAFHQMRFGMSFKDVGILDHRDHRFWSIVTSHSGAS